MAEGDNRIRMGATALGAVDEIQVVTLTDDTDGGTFTLTFEGDTTSALAWDATSATIQTALEALTSIGAGNVAVAGDGPHTVTFDGDLAGQNVSLLTADGSSLTATTGEEGVSVDQGTQGREASATGGGVDEELPGGVAKEDPITMPRTDEAEARAVFYASANNKDVLPEHTARRTAYPLITTTS